MSKLLCRDESELYKRINDPVNGIICLKVPLNDEISTYLKSYNIQTLFVNYDSISCQPQIFVIFKDKNSLTATAFDSCLYEQWWVDYVVILN
jgi:hypothetical protein